MIASITIDELLKYNSLHIIDIRSEQSYNNNHIDGAINIPYEKLIANPAKFLDRNQKYFLYCQKGLSSKKVCSILTSFGYKVVHIIGGYEEWILKRDMI